MLFNSYVFIAFFVAVLLLHWSLPKRGRNLLLLGASYLFYGTWNWKFLALIWFSTLLDFFLARAIEDAGSERVRRGALLASVVGNLSILGFFKYFNFFIESLDLLLANFGTSAAALHLDLVLPLGISFYTFQTMGYTIDVYRGQMRAVREPLDFALFICFFPQLVAGPIERAGHLMPQIQCERRVDRNAILEGTWLTSWGLFKKVFVADNLSRIVDPVYTLGAQPSGLEVILATLAFLFQVYADFSAYSDIARGTARMLGFDLMQNFEAPYFSRDMGEFWRRWHISLSTWLRDYLYIPLGGSRGREPRVAFNLFMTLLLAGLWHGSNGTFLIFGAYHGLLVVVARFYRRFFPVRESSARWPGSLGCMALFAFGLVFFRGQTVAQCFDLIGRAFTDTAWVPGPGGFAALATIAACALPMLVYDLVFRRLRDETFVLRLPVPARVLVTLAVLYLVVLFGRSDALEFVYFQF